MSLIYRAFPNFISYIGNFIYVTYIGIVYPASVLQAASNSIFSLLRVAAFGAYSYVQHRSEFVAKHVEQTSAAQPA